MRYYAVRGKPAYVIAEAAIAERVHLQIEETHGGTDKLQDVRHSTGVTPYPDCTILTRAELLASSEGRAAWSAWKLITGDEAFEAAEAQDLERLTRWEIDDLAAEGCREAAARRGFDPATTNEISDWFGNHLCDGSCGGRNAQLQSV